MIRQPFNILLLLRTATIWRGIGSTLLLVAGFSASAAAAVSLELKLARERIYPGESVPVTVTLRVSDARVRNIGYPRLAAPSGGSVAFAPPVQGTDANDPNVVLYRFSGRISSVKPGQLGVGPASLDLEIMEAAKGSDGFFGAIDPWPQSLVTAPVTLTVLPLPTDRPASFGGAIGTFTMAVSTNPAVAAVGEPLTITTTIGGTGNLDGANCPDVTVPTIRTYPPTARRRQNEFICEQVVIPTATGAPPPVIWSYFSPSQQRFQTLRHTLPVVVPAPVLAAALTKGTAASSAARAPKPPTSRSHLPAWLAAACILIGAVWMARVILGNRHPAPTAGGDACQAVEQLLGQAELALASNDVEMFYTMVMQVLQEIVAGEAGLPPQGIAGITNTATGGETAELFRRCHQVRYGHILPPAETVSQDLHRLYTILTASRQIKRNPLQH
jgi:hypothetical protein